MSGDNVHKFPPKHGTPLSAIEYARERVDEIDHIMIVATWKDKTVSVAWSTMPLTELAFMAMRTEYEISCSINGVT